MKELLRAASLSHAHGVKLALEAAGIDAIVLGQGLAGLLGDPLLQRSESGRSQASIWSICSAQPAKPSGSDLWSSIGLVMTLAVSHSLGT